jgi:hypothetical protein
MRAERVLFFLQSENLRGLFYGVTTTRLRARLPNSRMLSARASGTARGLEEQSPKELGCSKPYNPLHVTLPRPRRPSGVTSAELGSKSSWESEFRFFTEPSRQRPTLATLQHSHSLFPANLVPEPEISCQAQRLILRSRGARQACRCSVTDPLRERHELRRRRAHVPVSAPPISDFAFGNASAVLSNRPRRESRLSLSSRS